MHRMLIGKEKVMPSVDYCGDTYSGAPYISRVRFVFSRRCKDFFDKELDKRFSKTIIHVRVSRK